MINRTHHTSSREKAPEISNLKPRGEVRSTNTENETSAYTVTTLDARILKNQMGYDKESTGNISYTYNEKNSLEKLLHLK